MSLVHQTVRFKLTKPDKKYSYSRVLPIQRQIASKSLMNSAITLLLVGITSFGATSRLRWMNACTGIGLVFQVIWSVVETSRNRRKTMGSDRGVDGAVPDFYDSDNWNGRPALINQQQLIDSCLDGASFRPMRPDLIPNREVLKLA